MTKIKMMPHFRRWLRKQIALAERAHAKHRRQFGQCLPSCEEAIRHHAKLEVLATALHLTGGRVPADLKFYIEEGGL